MKIVGSSCFTLVAAGAASRSSARRAGSSGYSRGTVSRLWLNTSGRAATTISTAPGLRRKSGVSTSIVVPGAAARMARMTAAKCAGAAVGQVVAVDRGDDDVLQAELRHGVGDAVGFVGVERAGQAGAHVAEGAGAGAGVAHDHHGGVALRPALADVGAGGFLAHRDQAVVAHQGAGLVVDRMGGRLHPDPGGLALDRVVRPVRLLRVAQAVVDDEAGGHGGEVAGEGRGVKTVMVGEDAFSGGGAGGGGGRGKL